MCNLSDVIVPRLVYRPTTIIRVDVPGFDWVRVDTQEELALRLAEGWTLSAVVPESVVPPPPDTLSPHTCGRREKRQKKD